MRIQKKLIDILHYNVFHHDVEVCGFFNKKTNGVYDTFAIDQGQKENVRGMCTQVTGEKTNVRFHTHPTSSYAYPSYEDLVSVMKPREHARISSIIFTIWGAWIIFPGELPIDVRLIVENKKEYELSIKNFHQEQKSTESHTKSKLYSPEIQSIINDYISTIEALFGQYVTIRFLPWTSIISTHEVVTLGVKKRRLSNKLRRYKTSTKMKSIRRRTYYRI